MNPEEILEALAAESIDIADLTVEQLQELRTHLRAGLQEMRGELDEAEDRAAHLEQMQAHRTLYDAVAAQLATATEQAETLEQTADALASFDDTPEEESTEETEEEEPADESMEEEEEPARTASLSELARRRSRRSGTSTEVRDEVEPLNPIEALPGLNSFSVGHRFESALAVASAMADRYGQIAPKPGQKVDYARFAVGRSRQEHRFNLTDSAEENHRTLRELNEILRETDNARVASGGPCAPAEVMYDFYRIDTRSGVLTLPTVGLPRGRVQLPTSPSIQDVLGQTGIATEWTIENDTDPSDPATKPCITVTCPEFGTFQVSAWVTCRQYGNFGARFYPENVANFDSLTLVAHDHDVSAALIADVVALATAHVVGGNGGGAWTEFTDALSFESTWYRSKYRMDPSARLEVLAPLWVRAAVAQDIINRNSTVSFANALQQVDAWLAAANLSVQWLYNWQNIEDSGIWPADADFVLFAPGTFLRADAGTLDLGVVRDSTLNSTNDYQNFVETFEGIVMPGHEALSITGVPTCPTGNAAGYRVDELVCAAS